MISFIMPVKNMPMYVGKAIDALINANYCDWELIAVEDHSTDNTFDILKELEKKDKRIKVFKNIGNGKVVGFNYGYALSTGNAVKCIAADDLVDPKLFSYIDGLNKYDVICHDAFITNMNLKIIGIYSLNKFFFTEDFIYCFKYLLSLPSWTWIFNKYIGDKIFPMPNDLPFEDIWFSLVIKKYAKNIKYIKEKLYYYRQHNNQAFGGIFNFDEKIVSFRARRVLKFIEIIEKEDYKLLDSDTKKSVLLRESKIFNTFLNINKGNLKLLDVIKSNIPFNLKFKIIIYKKLYFIAPYAFKLKWLFNKIRV